MKRSSEKAIKDLFAFYGAFQRPLSFVELSTRIPRDTTPEELMEFLDDGLRSGKLIMEDGFYWSKEFVPLRDNASEGVALSGMRRRAQDLFLDEKWKKLIKLSRWFRYVPFFEFVMASGSLSFGNVNSNSDFDVLTGVRSGRIFTARYFAGALFSLLRARRLDDLQASSPEKLCFNHFVTSGVYEKEPHNYYRHELYRNMIPLWCEEKACKKFIEKNEWSGIRKEALLDLHHVVKNKSAFARFIEWTLGGQFGDLVEERIARPIAMKRLSTYLSRKNANSGAYGKRVIISDDELEFHFVLNYEKKFEDLGTI
ncbi:MAG: hypothetical protein AAB920_02165 [Patescibacteria group bacterium]